MKNIMAFLLFAISGVLIAQPTITGSVLPSSGTIFIANIDTLGASLWVDSAGPNKVWDYSADFNVHYTTFDTFQNASNSSNSGYYPSADLYYSNATIDYFYKTKSQGLYLDGLCAGALLNVDYNPDELMMPTPFTYLDLAIDTSRMLVSMGPMGDAISNKVKKYKADAYGTLTTPAGTFANVLRMEITHHMTDSVLTYIGPTVITSVETYQTVEYEWVQNDLNLRLMNITLDSLGMIDQGYYFSPAQTITDLEEGISFKNNISLYPNPVNGLLNSGLKKGESMHLYDLSGRLVFSTTINSKYQTIDLTGLQKGIYVYMMKDDNGQIIDQGKLQKN